MSKITIIVALSLLCLVFFLFEIVEAQIFPDADLRKIERYPINFKKVESNYYRSGIIQKRDYASLTKLGIKTIIDLRMDLFGYAKKEKLMADSLGIKYFNIPMNPFLPPNEEQIKKFFSIMDDENNLPILIHCLHGQDRTGIMVALHRVRNNHWNYAHTYKEMLNNGYHLYKYPKLKQFLKKYASENSF